MPEWKQQAHPPTPLCYAERDSKIGQGWAFPLRGGFVGAMRKRNTRCRQAIRVAARIPVTQCWGRECVEVVPGVRLQEPGARMATLWARPSFESSAERRLFNASASGASFPRANPADKGWDVGEMLEVVRASLRKRGTLVMCWCWGSEVSKNSRRCRLAAGAAEGFLSPRKRQTHRIGIIYKQVNRAAEAVV